MESLQQLAERISRMSVDEIRSFLSDHIKINTKDQFALWMKGDESAPVVTATAVDDTFYNLERKLLNAQAYGEHDSSGRSSVPYSSQWMAFRQDIIDKYTQLPSGTSCDVKKALLSQFEQANTKIKEILAL